MKISIITCTKDSERYISVLLDSISIQTNRDIEHIIVDGFSTDKTKKILQEYQKNSDYKVKVKFRKPKGISDAMNFGLKYASGDICLFIQSDDSLYSPTTLMEAKKFFEKENKGILVGRCVYVDQKNSFIKFHPNKFKLFFIKLFPKTYLKLENFIPHSSTFMKRELIKNLSYDSSLKFAMDYDLWLRIFPISGIFISEKTFSNFMFHEGGVSSNSQNKIKMLEEERDVRKKYLGKFEFTISSMFTRLFIIRDKLKRLKK